MRNFFFQLEQCIKTGAPFMEMTYTDFWHFPQKKSLIWGHFLGTGNCLDSLYEMCFILFHLFCLMYFSLVFFCYRNFHVNSKRLLCLSIGQRSSNVLVAVVNCLLLWSIYNYFISIISYLLLFWLYIIFRLCCICNWVFGCWGSTLN